MSRLAINGGTPVRTTPFPAWPYYDNAERHGLQRVLERRVWGARATVGEGTAAAFEEEFARFHGAPASLAVTNGTQALQLALELMGVGPGDDVLVPALTPVPTANAVRQRGAVPIAVDVDPNTYCLAPDRLDDARTERTRAVIPVHLCGHVADLDRILAWAARAGVGVIQDAAHAHGARWQDRGLGEFGTIATFSFMQSKVMTAGEGGALLLADADQYDEAFARHCVGRRPPGSEPGFHTSSSNYRISEFTAAVLSAQLSRLADQNTRREQRWKELTALLAQIPGVTPQARDPRCTLHSYYMAAMTIDPDRYGRLSRNRVVEALHAEGIPARQMFPPLHRSPAFWEGADAGSTLRAADIAARCPNSDHLGNWGMFLFHQVLLGDDPRDVHDIAEALDKVLSGLDADPIG